MGAKMRFTAKFVGFGGDRTAISCQESAEAALARISRGKYTVKSAKWTERRKNPAPPFTTSNLQQEAARKLNFTTSKTMLIAQQLYEGVEIQGEGAVVLSAKSAPTQQGFSEALDDVRAISAELFVRIFAETPNF
jgi:DNA topoisomerase-1